MPASGTVPDDPTTDLQSAPDPPGAGHPRVLIVDDEPDVGQLVADVLSEEGWDATTVHSTHEALELLRSQSYSLVIADLLMPDGGGRRILEDNSTREHPAPVLIISGTIDLGGDAICRMGAVHCLAKPFSIGQLIEAAQAAAGLTG